MLGLSLFEVPLPRFGVAAGACRAVLSVVAQRAKSEALREGWSLPAEFIARFPTPQARRPVATPSNIRDPTENSEEPLLYFSPGFAFFGR